MQQKLKAGTKCYTSIITSLHNCPLEDFQKVMKKVRGLWQQGVCVVHSVEVCEAGRMEGV